MSTTVEMDGRVALPPEVRAAAGIRPGMVLEVHYQAGRIELLPTAAPVRLERRGALTVAEPVDPREPLSEDTVELVLAGVRGEGGGSW